MKIKPEELAENNYQLADSMNHSELIPFVKEYISKGNWSSSAYYTAMIVPLLLLLFFSIRFHIKLHLGIGTAIVCFLIGVGISYALIPLHELIHVIAYKLVGARNTSYAMNIRKFYFLAIADKFVANKKEFRFVALAPFTLINSCLVIGLIFTSPFWTLVLLTILMVHSVFCSGDFALLSYFEFNKQKTVVTYDDKENKVSYFYHRK
jgi:hypothetical protein